MNWNKESTVITDHYFDWGMMWLTSITEVNRPKETKTKEQGKDTHTDTHTVVSLISLLPSHFLFFGNTQPHNPPAGIQTNKSKKLVWRAHPEVWQRKDTQRTQTQQILVTHHQKITPLPTVWSQAGWGLMFSPLIKLQRKGMNIISVTTPCEMALSLAS